MSDWLDAESHADRALEMFERGRWAEAESELRKAISLNPDQAEWHYNLGLTLEAAGRELEALACYERAVDLMPDQPEPLLAAGVVCNRQQRHREAVAWLDRVLHVAPSHESAYAQKIDALTRLGEPDEAVTAWYLAQQVLEEPSASCLAAVAEALVELEDWDRAAWCLREALRLDPQMPRLRARLAFVLASTGKPQQALQMYLRDLRDDPGNLDTLLDYGELLVDLGRLAEAAEKFRRVLEIEPANVDAHFRLAEIAFRSGRFEQAHLEYELVLKLDGEYPGIRAALAETMMRRGRPDGARRILRLELDAWERDDRLERGPDDDAVDQYDRAAWSRLGDLLLAAGLDAEAARLLGRLADACPDDAALLRRLAVARFRSGDDDGGAAAARRALRFDPACLASMHNLALIALRRRQPRVAAGWVARGLRVDRHDVELRRLRMQAWIALLVERLVAWTPSAILGRRAARRAAERQQPGFRATPRIQGR